MRNSGNSTQTLKRSLDILFVLGEAESTLSTSEIAERVEIPESTAYRLIQTLEKEGLISRKDKGKLGLGMRILDLARSLSLQMNQYLNEIARPIMEELTNTLNETTILTIRTGQEVICIESCESTRLIRFVAEKGKLLPLHLGASGKAILAFESEQIIDNVLASISDPKDKKSLLEDLAQIKEAGYSSTFGEVDPEVYGIAAPIFDKNGKIAASITIAGSGSRWKEPLCTTYIQAVVDATKKVTEQLKMAF